MTKAWFRPKRIGYGAVPISWQGWAVMLGGALATAAALNAAMLAWLGLIAGGAALALGLTILALVILVALTTVASRRTDGGWHRRNGRE